MHTTHDDTKRTDEKIIIKIRNSESAHSFSISGQSSEFIQEESYQRVLQIIHDDINQLIKEYPDSRESARDNVSRVHNSIFIDGERGSGKTSFLLTTLMRLPEDPSIRRAKIGSLECIDPTLITSKNNFFILIIARIKKLIEARFREHLPGEGTSDREGCYRELNDSLKTLANGLCMLEQVGNGGPLAQDEWADAQYIMRKGLEDADGGLELETRFHKFVNNSLKYLGKDAFILGIDDIDTDFQNGIAVLEVLRKYLTTPRIIICIAGDFNLLRNLLQRHYYKIFTADDFKRFKDKKELKELVENLTSQYLKKILPPRRRIILDKIYKLRKNIYIERPDIESIEYQHYKQEHKDILETINGDVPLTQFFAALVHLWYKLPREICRYMGEYFFRLPLRTIISLLSSLLDKENGFCLTIGVAYYWNENTRTDDYKKFINILKKVHIDDTVFFDILSQIVFTYQEEIIDFGFSSEEFNYLFENFNMCKLGKILYKNDLLSQMSPLIPFDVSSMHANKAFSIYPLCYGSFIAEIKNIFEYFIRVLMLRDIKFEFENADTRLEKIVDTLYRDKYTISSVCDKLLSLHIEQTINSTLNTIHFPKKYQGKYLVECINDKEESLSKIATCFRNITCITLKQHGIDRSSECTYFSKPHIFLFLLLLLGAPGGMSYTLNQMNYKKTYLMDLRNNTCKLLIDPFTDYLSDGHGIEFLKNIEYLTAGYLGLNTNKYIERWKIMLPLYMIDEIYKEFIRCDIKIINDTRSFSDGLIDILYKFNEIVYNIWHKYENRITDDIYQSYTKQEYESLCSFFEDLIKMIEDLLNIRTT